MSDPNLEANQPCSQEEEIYLTNACGDDTCHVSEDDLDKAGLPYDDGHFPLTAAEAAQLEEETTFFDYTWFGGYTTLWQGRKWLSPQLELAYDDPFWGEDNGFASEWDVLEEANSVLVEAKAYAEARGGSAVLDTDFPGRIVVRMRLPFAA